MGAKRSHEAERGTKQALPWLLKLILAELGGVLLVLLFALLLCLAILLAMWAAWYRDRYAIGFLEFLRLLTGA